MIEIKNLTKKFGRITAVDNISFTVNDGEIVGFLGPNGAGKSTTMNMMTGFISSTEGTVIVDGFDILEEPEKAKSRIGYLPETPPVYGDMTVTEYIEFVCDLKRVKPSERKAMIADILESVKLTEVKNRIIKNLSKGYRQRVGLAQALVGYPDTLILDEPTVGLDPGQVLEMREVIKALGEKHTVILSSHILQEVSAVCDRVIIINKGKLITSDTTSDLSDKITGNRVLLDIIANKDEAENAINALECVKSTEAVKKDDTLELVIEGKEGIDIREDLFRLCSEKGFVILVMKPVDVSLEDIFIKVVNGDYDEELINAAAEEKNAEDKPDIFNNSEDGDWYNAEDAIKAAENNDTEDTEDTEDISSTEEDEENESDL